MRRALLLSNIIWLMTLACFTAPGFGADGDSIFDPDGTSSPPAGTSKPPAPPVANTPKERPKTLPPKADPPRKEVPASKPAVPKAPVVRVRLPIPPEADLIKAQANIREIFKLDYSNRDRAGADALVKKLLLQAERNGIDTVTRFAALDEAREVSARSGDLSTARAVIGKIAQSYRVSRERVCLETLDLAYKNNAVNMAEITESYLSVADDLSDLDDFDSASKAASKAVASASRTKNPGLLARAKQAVRTTSEGKRQHDLAEAAQTTLLLKPDDPDANFVLGRYLCSVKDDWMGGLKRLAKCNDAESKKLAEADLSEPATPDEMFALATRWWGFGQHKSDAVSVADSHKRAGHWYCRAFPGLKGLAKSAAQARIADVFAGVEFGNTDIAKWAAAGGENPALYAVSDPSIPDVLTAKTEPRRIRISGTREPTAASTGENASDRYGKAVVIQKMRWGGGQLTLGASTTGGDHVRYEALMVNQAGQLVTQPLDLNYSALCRWDVSDDGNQVRLIVSSEEKVVISLSLASKEFKGFGFAASCLAPKDAADLDVTLGGITPK